MDFEYRRIPSLNLRKYVCTSLVETVCRVRVNYIHEGAGATSILGCYPKQVQHLFTLYEKTEVLSRPSGYS